MAIIANKLNPKSFQCFSESSISSSQQVILLYTKDITFKTETLRHTFSIQTAWFCFMFAHQFACVIQNEPSTIGCKNWLQLTVKVIHDKIFENKCIWLLQILWQSVFHISFIETFGYCENIISHVDGMEAREQQCHKCVSR